MIGQLYYTSCEKGLTGSVGYQFNAVSPGLAPELLREVERLSGYDPPDRIGGAPTDAEIAAAPVSLVYRPGEPAIVANVVYVGADFSNRYGNFFSHAIVLPASAGTNGVFPVELWHSPDWTATESPTVDLPALPAPPARGPIEPGAVAAFVAAQPMAAELPRMVTAAGLAITQRERSVVIVENTDEAAAHWIAALTYLLPPALARAMSFTTYNYRPSYTEFHVVGTLPDTQVETGERAASQLYYLFDATGGPSTVLEVHPVARLAVACGVGKVAELWAAAEALADGTEADLDAWHPVVASAAAVTGLGIDRADLAAALVWLTEHAPRLGGRSTADIGAALRGHASFGIDDLALLERAARSGGAAELQARCELELVDAQLQAIEGGRAWPGPRHPLVTQAAREMATERGRAALQHADLATAAALVEWVAAREVPLRDDTLAGVGSRLLGPQLVHTPSRLADHRALGDHPAVRSGVVEHLAERAARDPGAVLDALEGGLGQWLGTEIQRYPELGELAVLAAGRRSPEDRPRALEQVLARRRARGAPTTVDDALLSTLWPQRSMRAQDARYLLQVLSPAQAADGELPAWISRLVMGGTSVTQEYYDLCWAVEQHAAFRRLSREAADTVRGVIATVEALRTIESYQGSEHDLIAQKIVELVHEPPRILEKMVVDQLVPTISAFGNAALWYVATYGPTFLFEALLAAADAQLADQRAEPTARWWAVRDAMARREHARTRRLDAMLLRHVPNWKKRRLRGLTEELQRYPKHISEGFEQWLAWAQDGKDNRRARRSSDQIE